MNDYIQLRIDADPCSETITDLLAAFLCDEGYESFVADDKGMTAFVSKPLYDKEIVERIIADFPIEVHFEVSIQDIEGRDWNEEWEKNYFQPIIIDDRCVVHSSFHKDVPKADYDIVIDPKMAFGTGHHATTSQMMQYILEMDMAGKTVIDMGTGTGILALLSGMTGADHVDAIEIDEFAYNNAVENAAINSVKIDFHLGDAHTLENIGKADVFLANINRNVITADIEKYASKLKDGGIMLLSGFYEEDIPIVCDSARTFGLKFAEKRVLDRWAAIKLTKN